MQTRFNLADASMLLGTVLIGVGMYFLVGWAGVLLWCGLLLLAVGVAEARRRT
jgi:hypothetical protein